MLTAFTEPYTSAAAEPMLSASQRLGLLYLIHKGHNKPRDTPYSYRPITLLNCDYKLVAKVVTKRLSGAADAVLDGTQTAFVPGRWIGDNVLFHLEEVDYLEATEQPGCVLFLDFEKAYDRMSRPWIAACMQRMAFPAQAIRWVGLLLKGTEGRILYNGFFSRQFAVQSGVAQGSPLSPLIYAIAAQPLAARMRQLQQAGTIDAVQMPDGSKAPPSHQHADDTTLHTATIEGAATALDQVVQPFCQATGSRLNRSKTKGMVLGSHPTLTGVEPRTGAEFVTSVVHLGITITTGDRTAAATQMYEKRLQGLRLRIQHWQHLHLSQLGRDHIGKQVLANTLAYHFTFVRPPDATLQQIDHTIDWYVVKGCAPDSPDTPVTGRPAKQIASLPRDMGGLAIADVRAHRQALEGKVAAAFLHPRRMPWKQLMAAGIQHKVPSLGLRVVIKVQKDPNKPGKDLIRLNPRHRSYIAGMHRAGLVRALPHSTMSVEQLGCEGLIGNHSIVDREGEAFKTAASLPAVFRTAVTVRDAVEICKLQPGTSTGPSPVSRCLPICCIQIGATWPKRQLRKRRPGRQSGGSAQTLPWYNTFHRSRSIT